MFLFEITDNTPTVAAMYASGILLALLVFAATYFHRQVGLIVLIVVGLICAGNFAPNIIGQNYADESGYFGQITFALSIILFFAAILLKRFLKEEKGTRLN